MIVRKENPVELESIRPGSFGIRSQHIVPDSRREALCDGGIIHSHKDPMEGFGRGSAICVPVVQVRDEPVKRTNGYTIGDMEEIEAAEFEAA